MTTPAIYVGLQAGFRQQPPIELYNLVAPVGEHPAGSTVSRQTLEKPGVNFPPAPQGRKSRRGSGPKSAS
jgi:hypothetical protein